MSFYRNKNNRNILYKTPEHKVYVVSIYDKKNRKSETSVGFPDRIDTKPSFKGIDEEDYTEPIDRQYVPSSVIKTLKETLNEEEAP